MNAIQTDFEDQIRDLKREREDVYRSMKEIARKENLSDQEQRLFKTASADFQAMSDDIETLQRRATDAQNQRGGSTRPVLGQMMRALYNAPHGSEIETRDFTLSGSTAVIQNPSIQSEFFLTLKANNPLAALGARFFNGENYSQFPVETTAPAVVWFAEGDTLSPDATAAIGSRKVTYSTAAMILKASNFWLEDSGELGASIITEMGVQAINEAIIKTVLSGASASKQPVGLDNLIGSGVQTVANGAMTLTGYDKMSEAVKKLLAVNVQREKIGYLYSPTVWEQMQGLADSTTQPKMKPEGLRDIPGYVSSAVLETYDTNTTTRMYFGDWSNLMVATAGGPRVQILRERYADNLSTAFLIHLRLDHQFIRRDNFCVLTGIELS